MTQYSLTCVNNSKLTGDFCVFQKQPPIAPMPGNLFATAWLVKPAASTTSVTFTWNTDYGFTWSETGTLIPGVTFKASQTWAADLSGHNYVDLTVDPVGATTFANSSGNGIPGGLTINQTGLVVPGQTSIGIAMSGSAMCAIQAAPNMKAVFTPHPSYYVMFGTFEQGQVIDIEDLTSNYQQVTFYGAQTSATVVLGGNNVLSQTV